jgi:hypothetical protein
MSRFGKSEYQQISHRASLFRAIWVYLEKANMKQGALYITFSDKKSLNKFGVKLPPIRAESSNPWALRFKQIGEESKYLTCSKKFERFSKGSIIKNE